MLAKRLAVSPPLHLPLQLLNLSFRQTTLHINTLARLKCPKCEKVFAENANEWSLRKHLEGKTCTGQPPSSQKQPSRRPPSIPTSFIPPPSAPGPSFSAIIQCPGLPLLWDFDAFWSTYPFHVHDPKSKYNPGFNFISLSPPLIRSACCVGSSKTPGTPCAWCSSLTHDVDDVRNRANQSFAHLRVEERFNHTQLLEKVADLKKQVNDLNLEKANLKRSLASAHEDVAEYKWREVGDPRWLREQIFNAVMSGVLNPGGFMSTWAGRNPTAGTAFLAELWMQECRIWMFSGRLREKFMFGQ
ncbi:hypothetical protein B0H10DRAFT_1961256 [Mycena sp. CBHHK59/15]|nr:hypothetical protein B0H10DRAFT_1961256 [Mycena sp. CBHHK59/15]